eukprot:TRINITY_DN15448_c0_g1_i2.p1 TRINITY_DN15448_c0_g1~~TRINITY_DN15448_c0_g1_i2.p1  ORF type:complete len:306 (+),score=50.41 TRINITY_DN15448_c0_g1_i2:59-976(+)
MISCFTPDEAENVAWVLMPVHNYWQQWEGSNQESANGRHHYHYDISSEDAQCRAKRWDRHHHHHHCRPAVKSLAAPQRAGSEAGLSFADVETRLMSSWQKLAVPSRSNSITRTADQPCKLAIQSARRGSMAAAAIFCPKCSLLKSCAFHGTGVFSRSSKHEEHVVPDSVKGKPSGTPKLLWDPINSLPRPPALFGIAASALAAATTVETGVKQSSEALQGEDASTEAGSSESGSEFHGSRSNTERGAQMQRSASSVRSIGPGVSQGDFTKGKAKGKCKGKSRGRGKLQSHTCGQGSSHSGRSVLF